jgi:hypothetical protein
MAGYPVCGNMLENKARHVLNTGLSMLAMTVAINGEHTAIMLTTW